MPFNDSKQSEGREERDREVLRQAVLQPDPNREDIVTSIEADAQARAEHEFETERKIPPSCKTAIVSVNGEDVDEVPLADHERAA